MSSSGTTPEGGSAHGPDPPAEPKPRPKDKPRKAPASKPQPSNAQPSKAQPSEAKPSEAQPPKAQPPKAQARPRPRDERDAGSGKGSGAEGARPAMLRVKDLEKTYRTDGAPVPAIRGMDLSVHPGEFVAVMGPSGSGKSTLLHILGGLDAATRGEIWLRGRRIDALGQRDWAILRRRHIGIVFQSFNLISNMTVADNVELPALLAGAGAREARSRRESLLDELGVGDKAGAGPTRLSGGEQQLVAIARALANEPSLLLADEPTGNLDSANTRVVLQFLGGIHGRGQTMLLVTHDARVASMADRVVSILDGMIVDDAPISGSAGAAATVTSIFDLRG